jgi:general secretion pathway protein I
MCFKRNPEGFTLLEVMIALAIMALALGSILAVEQGSINATARAKQMHIVAMLAQNQMISTEYQIEGKTFEEVKKEDSGVFAEPYTDYRWKTTIKPVKFPNMQLGTEEKNTEATQDQIMKMMSEYLSRSIHEIQVRIFWKKGSTEQDYTISTFWVNFQNEISF